MKLKPHNIVFAALLGMATLVQPAHAQDREIRVAADAEYPPFNYKDENGDIVGFDVDITMAACAAAELQCSFVAQSWDGLIPGLIVKKYDAISASMVANEERKKKVNFTDKIYEMPSQFLVSKDSDFTFDKEGLAGKSLGSQRATVHSEYLEAEFGDVATIKLYETQDQANLDLASGRLDALLGDVLVLNESFLKSDSGAGFEFRGEEIRFGKGIAIAVRKDDTELLDALNGGIEAIRESGEYQEISEKYFGRDIY